VISISIARNELQKSYVHRKINMRIPYKIYRIMYTNAIHAGLRNCMLCILLSVGNVNISLDIHVMLLKN